MAAPKEQEQVRADEQVSIVAYDHGFREDVVRLWNDNFNHIDRNSYYRDIDASLRDNPGLFWLAVVGGRLVGTCIGASDGHRCWIYYLCVQAQMRRRKIGTSLMDHVEGLFRQRGVRQVGLQVLETRRSAMEFYRSRGYFLESTRCFGKRLS